MMHNHPDLLDVMVRDHLKDLRDPGIQARVPRPTGVVRRAIGRTLIRLGERVGGQRVQPAIPRVSGKLATP